MNLLRYLPTLLLLALTTACAPRATAINPPATQPGLTNKLEHITVDVKNKQVRVECQSLAVESPLEFFCVVAGGPEHETVLRTLAKPSDIHLALLMLGLKPGQPVRYAQAADRWYPPMGPPVRIGVEFQKDGKLIQTSANRLMKNTKTGKPMPDLPWIFVGSQMMEDGTYAADVTGYVVSVVNFDLTVIDVPDLRSSDNETLEWQADLAALPPAGSTVTMILEPVGQPATAPTQQSPTQQSSDQHSPDQQTPAMESPAPADPANPSPQPLRADEARMKDLRKRWEQAVRPNVDALRTAAQSHYDVIMSLRAEQQKLIDEADRIPRLIDDLDREYQNITTPRPSDQ